jgi:outer membrane receptor for ferric coprogen and ferric-rhodotorulic acid
MNTPSHRVKPLYQQISYVRRHAKAVLVCGALFSSMSYISPVYAQISLHSYELEAGNLSQVLNRFAAEAGVVIYFDAAITRGKRTNGLNGEYSVDAGLQKILNGSGLRAVLKEEGSYQIETADTTGPVDLSAISVDANTISLGQTTENSGSYTTEVMSTGTGLVLSQRQTPQSVSVVTRQQIEDQNLNDVMSVLEQTPGVVVNTIVQSWISLAACQRVAMFVVVLSQLIKTAKAI